MSEVVGTNSLWKEYTQETLSQNEISNPLWVKINLRSLQVYKFLRLNSESLYLCDIYLYKNTRLLRERSLGISTQTNHTFMSLSQKLISLEDNPDTVYIKLRGVPVLSISFDLLDVTQVLQDTETTNLKNGIFYGVLFFLFVYNLVLYFYTRLKSYLPYLVYIFSLSLYFVIIDTNYLLAWFHLYNVNLYLLLQFSMMMVFVSMFYFPLLLLDFKTLYPKVEKVLRLLIYTIVVFELLLMGLVFGERFNLYNIVYNLESVFIILASLISLYFSYVLAIKGNKIALYYAIAWSILFMGLLNYYLHYLLPYGGLLEAKDYFRVAIVIEGVMFSFILGLRTKTLEKFKVQHERVLIQQEHNAKIATILSEVSHQWRQPLNTINAIVFENLLCKTMPSKVKYTQDLEEIESLSLYLSSTIDEFQYNYLKEDDATEFLLDDVVAQVMFLLSRDFQKQGIECHYETNKEHQYHGSQTYLIQVLLIILNNAIEAFSSDKMIKKIQIRYANEMGAKYLYIEDNAGGIKAKELEDIFKPVNSSKEHHKGLGLFMARKIIQENFKGTIKVKNTSKGAQFQIRINNG